MVVHENDYIRYLNRNYCIISHLAERLDELRRPDLFIDSPAVIDIAISALEQQLLEADQIFKTLNIAFSFEDSEHLILLLEHLFSRVQDSNGRFSLLSMLDYIITADVLLKESANLAELSLVNMVDFTAPGHYLYQQQTLEPLRQALIKIEVPA